MIRRVALFAMLMLTTCRHNLSPQDVSIAGLVPPLALKMTNVATGKQVTAADFNGKVVLVFFGYTNCPDACPTTLYNLDKILARLGPLAAKIQVLYVTVDPDRDTPAVLTQYTALFGPNITGLRGNANELYSFARRYRVVFSVSKGPPYTVTHSAAVYVFNPRGQAQFIIAGLDTTRPDFKGIAGDIAAVAQH